MQTLRSFCFTIFGDWDKSPLESEDFKCAVVQQEKCPDTGRLHYQGFAMLTSPKRLNAIKNILGSDTVHVEKNKGTPQQAWDYCTKEDTRVDGPWIFGSRPSGRGAR